MLDIYLTRQLPQAAYLLASGATFLRCDRSGGRFVDLVFSDPDGSASRLAAEFYEGGTCQGLKYYKAPTELRHAIQEATGTLWGKGVSRG